MGFWLFLVVKLLTLHAKRYNEMGGHGGLNILPQKSWHGTMILLISARSDHRIQQQHYLFAVYNKDNRAKVEKDEAEYNEKQKHLKEKNKRADQEHRRRLLLERARQRHGGAATVVIPHDDDAIDAHTAIYIDNAHDERYYNAVPSDAPSVQQPPSTHIPSSDAVPTTIHPSSRQEHINLFKEEEHLERQRNQERQQEERTKKKQRGDPKTQTSDANFDARFEFAHGVGGNEHNMPWYARKRQHDGDTLTAGLDPGFNANSGMNFVPKQQRTVQEIEDKKKVQMGIWQAQGRAALAATAFVADDDKDEEEKKLWEKKEFSKKKERDKSKYEKKARNRHSQSSSKKKRKHTSDNQDDTITKIEKSNDVWLTLRKERLERESIEQQRQSFLIQKAVGSSTSGGGGNKYNSGYGYGRR